MPVTRYTYSEPGRVGWEDRGGTARFYRHDAMGSTTQLFDSAGTTTDTFRFDYFGVALARTGGTATPLRWLSNAGTYSPHDPATVFPFVSSGGWTASGSKSPYDPSGTGLLGRWMLPPAIVDLGELIDWIMRHRWWGFFFVEELWLLPPAPPIPPVPQLHHRHRRLPPPFTPRLRPPVSRKRKPRESYFIFPPHRRSYRPHRGGYGVGYEYGSYCGSKNIKSPRLNVLPQDCVDECCLKHDRCLEGHYFLGYTEECAHMCCDQNLIDCAQRVQLSCCCWRSEHPVGCIAASFEVGSGMWVGLTSLKIRQRLEHGFTFCPPCSETAWRAAPAFKGWRELSPHAPPFFLLPGSLGDPERFEHPYLSVPVWWT